MLKAAAQLPGPLHSRVATALGWFLVVGLICVGIWSTVVWLITFPMGLGLAGWLYFRTAASRLQRNEIFVAASGSGLAMVVTLAYILRMNLLTLFWQWYAFWFPLAGILFLAALSLWGSLRRRSRDVSD